MPRTTAFKFKIPHAFIFMSGIILICAILTYIIPSGAFQRSKKLIDGYEQTVIVPGTYRKIPKHFSLSGFITGDEKEGKASPISLLGLFTSIPRGLSQSASLIFFIFTIGAVFTLIHETGTITAIIYKLMDRFKYSSMLLPTIIFTSISLGSTLMGMYAEFIPLIPVFLFISKSFGYDRLFGIGMFILAFSIGWACGVTNPFNVQIAQKIAEVPIGSGIVFRILFFICCYGIGLSYLLRYGQKVKKDPSSSLMKNDAFQIDDFDDRSNRLEIKHILILFVAIAALGIILYGVQTMGWYLNEMSGGFLAVGVLSALISGMKGEKVMSAMIKGLETMIVPALIVGVARGINVVLVDGQIIDTILNHAAGILREQPILLASEGMFVFQSTLNFLIPSASGQALVTMPLMTPLADLLGLSRQLTVFIFIIGDGISNLVIPSNGVLLALLGIAGVPYDKWFRFVLPVFFQLILVGALFIGIALYIGY